MILRKRTLRAFALLFALLAWGDDGSGTAAFCERARSHFNGLLRLCRSERKAYWNQRSADAIERYNQKSRELQATSEFLGRQANGEKLKGIFAFEYLNEINELQLNEATSLVEDLGREVLSDRFSSQLAPKLRDVEAQFMALQGKPQSESVRNAYSRFLELQRNEGQLEALALVKDSFTFEPKPYPFGAPTKTVVYVIHDWNGALARVDELDQQLQPIQDALQTARFFSPKDPNYWAPLIAQLTFLIAAIPGWIKSYHSDKRSWPIILCVVLSMLLSIFLVLYSSETFLNILRQSLVPSLFVAYWIVKDREWFRRVVARFGAKGAST